MRARYVVAWVVLLVVLNAAMVWYLRDRMSRPPEATSSNTPASPSARPRAADDPELQGLVFLAGSPEGAVLRLTRGDCSDGESQVAGWIAAPNGPPDVIELPAVSEVAGVGRTSGSWWIIGTDDACKITAWESESLKGASWSETDIPVEAWYLDPKDATQVYSPRGQLSLPGSCSATSVQAVGTRIYLVCADGRGQVADAGTREFSALPLNADVVALAADPQGRVAELSSGPNCLALVRVIEARQATGQHCFDPGKAPLAVAWVGGDLVAQVGLDLLSNAGGTWEIRS